MVSTHDRWQRNRIYWLLSDKILSAIWDKRQRLQVTWVKRWIQQKPNKTFSLRHMTDILYTSVQRSTSATNKKDKLNNRTLNQQPNTASTVSDLVFCTSIRILPPHQGHTVCHAGRRAEQLSPCDDAEDLVRGQLTRGAPPPPVRWSGASVPDTGCTVQCHCVPLPPPIEAPPPWGSARTEPGRGRSRSPRPLCRG